jgi:PAS domain S-box-containing protein
MDFHQLLQEQIKVHLTREISENSEFESFLKAINDSYLTFEKDKYTGKRIFQERDKVNSMKNQYKDKWNDSFNTIADNRNSGSVTVGSDYKKDKAVQNQLDRTIGLLRIVLDSIQSGILVEDENRKVLFVNQKFCEMFLIEELPENMTGTDCVALEEHCKTIFKKQDIFTERTREIIADKKRTTSELLETVTEGFLQREYLPVVIEEEHKGHLWKYVNITQKIKTRTLLEQSEERSRLIMNASLNAIISIDCDDKIIFWNKPATTIFGWESDEVIGKELSEIIIPPQYVESHKRGMSHYMKTGEGPVLNRHFQITGLNKQGVEFPIEISIIPVKQNGETFFCSFIQDISERKKAEDNLKSQEEKYRNIIANMNLGLMVVDNEEVIQFANQSFLDISGYGMEEILGKKASSIFKSEENQEIMQSKIEMRKQGGSDVYQMPVKNKNGQLRWWTIGEAPEFDDTGTLVGSIGIHLDVTEQKQMEIDLQKEKIKAQEASKAKETFLANMSHEIRTPLNAIIGFLRELDKEEMTEIQKNYIQNSSIASKHLLAIINNVLDISKIEAGEMSLEYEDFIFEHTIMNVHKVLETKAVEKGLTFSSTISKSVHPVLKGDALRLEQILFNLVGNALKFTNEGKVSVNCEVLSDEQDYQNLCIAVQDTGIGIEKDFVDSIFRKFSQEGKAITRKFGGTGLGMAITKELIQLMDGRIEVESNKNEGTLIQIFLRFQKGNEENLKISIIDEKEISIDNISVLLVEDNDLNRMVAQNSLRYYNCRVTEAVNGVKALEVLKEKAFDVILMDIQMPEMDGIETTKIIRNELKLTTPIIALTANAFKTEVERCREVGMDDYITKPFEEDMMIETIAKHVGKSHYFQSAKKEKTEVATTLYNLNSLYDLSTDDDEFVSTVMKMFIEQTPLMLDKTEQRIEENDFMGVYQVMHEMKPSIEILGIVSIMDTVKELERKAKETQEKDEIVRLFKLVNQTLRETVEQMKQDDLCK